VDNDSVICYGLARVVEDLDERKAALDTFNRCLQPRAAEISLEAAAKCYAVEINLTEMTGRREQDGERTYWRYTFSD
jgi:nitroimidazol reductase NimA-like FMN-containing flavoprotein (pyridoxamine 5'-phosphate oxidase superfamily)